MTERTRLELPRGRALSPVDRLIRFCMQNGLLVALALGGLILWGLMVAPFDWDLGGLPRDPVPVDAIPDLGENQQIVFTEWPGRSPQDIEDQVTYPLTVALLGVPGVKTIRSQSMFGFSSIYAIFDENVEFYWSRSRILEKLNSLPPDTLPDGVAPALGPDATALGQVFWYTLEGRDPDGNPASGWDPQELRSIHDWYVRYALTSAEGVSEVASIGGFVQEYQIDVDPDAMRAYGVRLDDVFQSVRMSNVDVGARTIEVNRVEYVVRGLGFIEDLADIEQSVIKSIDNVPITIGDIATVSRGPALRRGALDKEGAEATGGVVVVRYGANPLAAIKNVRDKVAEIAPGLPTRVVVDDALVARDAVAAFAQQRDFEAYAGVEVNHDGWLAWLRATPRDEWPDWVTTSQVTVVPFYDRTGLIYETLGTLSNAIKLQILVTVIVVLVMMGHLRSSILISAILPMAVLMAFIGMKLAGIDANIVALSGIAIAIGTMVDMGIILCENILRRLDDAPDDRPRDAVVFEAATEVGGAVLTAVLTTVVGFLPVFTMTGAEGKLFRPLAFTKTFALIAAVVLALTVLPIAARVLLAGRVRSTVLKRVLCVGLIAAGFVVAVAASWWLGLLLVALGAYHLVADRLPTLLRAIGIRSATAVAAIVVGVVLASLWLPLGPEKGILVNALFVAVLLGGVLALFLFFQRLYPKLLAWFLAHKLVYLSLPATVVLLGAMVWLGAGTVIPWVPEPVRETRVWSKVYHAFPGLGKEFMPPLDEGSFLYMPTTMPHASIGEVLDVIQLQDQRIASIPEVDTVVGKIGRVDSALDPAPLSMIETVINYKPEYIVDKDGRRLRFQFDAMEGAFARDDQGDLVPDANGLPYRQWRDEVRTPDDIWDAIVSAAQVPGTTSAPKLQPIITRIVMLQSGMRAPMGVKVRGPNLETIERVGIEIERFLKEVPGVEPPTVFAERIVGKPYLEIDVNREAIARYGIRMAEVQDVIEVAIGGRPLTTTVEGRERYPVRVRYKRELRDQIESLERILVPASDGAQIPLTQLAEVRYVRGPQVIKSEDTALTGYVTFDKQSGYAEVDVVDACRAYLDAQLDSGEWALPAGVSYRFAGNYENQVRAQKTLAVVLPLSLFVIFLILYLQFRSPLTTLIIFLGIVVAWSGGFCLMWLYGQSWFLDLTVAGMSLRDLFQVHPIMLSVAIWVGFLALFGIATDDGVVMATYLEQRLENDAPTTRDQIRAAVVEAGTRRVRPCLMTTATTLLALLPVLTATGRGADIMIPMAVPSFGGMIIELMTLFLVPVLYCAVKETALALRGPSPTQPRA
ncbi:MAG: efflux RND transporter permease subunit [bacterium]|nr:efflux RND transporter permease subunit [bacterium]